ncbi:zinc-finger homeodomain protein 2-like isoform X1 [Durio zibethinus]|uniref:Zinc-finger homeodomain protein 2-like isoform X1 n=1 Tax=Durio zibethinus TaxID=66656 RepID=A0A6P6BD49_DURZI|nr:zinc-finger homeodomain protein 2-like isoform X1 [Durio zibethinus]
MEFEDQEEQEEEMGLTPSYDSLSNSSRAKMSGVEPGSITPTGQQQQRKPRYRECLKNHAVGIGGHAVDGCGEFLPAGAEGTLNALKCAACACHRNFHRKETELGSPNSVPTTDFCFHNHHHQPPQFTPYFRAPAGYLQVAGQQRPLALPSTSGGGGGHSREDQEDVSNQGSSRKRFRTKFTQEQKEKMLGLAERLGWRIQKHDEAVVQQFCSENGVKRHVLKVWMHNNKHTLDIGALRQSGDMHCNARRLKIEEL